MKFYNEYKFLVTHENYHYVLSALRAFYGNTDPFPYGIVDSIYYDTLDRKFLDQCVDGNSDKTKFRIRGYGDGTFGNLQKKDKDLFVVKKRKIKIEAVTGSGGMAPEWEKLVGKEDNNVFSMIKAEADHFGNLYPSVRVKYHRHRFRAFDYRITLDSSIEISGFANGLTTVSDHAIIPYNVLEIKTADPRPRLPLFGLTKLPHISFSKFYLGLNLMMFREAV